ncbi:MAG: GNAT family N-acetyltransferase [Rufibacter sp.]
MGNQDKIVKNLLTIRSLQTPDISAITDYWLNSDAAFLQGMGVDLTKLPSREQWHQMLTDQINTPLEQKQSYALIWVLNGRAIGHSNTNKIRYGDEAYFHLHLWLPEFRKTGLGSVFVKLALRRFFQDLQLQRILCEPYALNPAPNKMLEKIGFDLVKEYVTIPGWVNFEQPVKRWQMTRERFERLYPDISSSEETSL